MKRYFNARRAWSLAASLLITCTLCSVSRAHIEYGLTSRDIPAPLPQSWDNREVGVFLPSAMSPDGLPRSQLLTKPIKSLDLMGAILYALKHNVDSVNAQMQRINDKYQYKVDVRDFSPSLDDLTLGVAEESGKDMRYTVMSPKVSWKNAWGTNFSADLTPGISGQKTSGSVSITQPLLKNFNIARLKLYDAESTRQAARYVYQSSIEQVVFQVIQSYVQWVQNQMDFSNSTANLHEQKTIYQNAKEKEAQGKISKNDLQQQQSSLLTTELALEKQKTSLLNTKQDLLQLLGFSPLDTSKVSINPQSMAGMIDKITVPLQDDSIQSALQHNPSYQQALIKLRMDQRNLMRDRNALKWDLSLGYTHNFGQDAQSKLLNPDDSVSLTLTIPVNNLSAKSNLISGRISYEIEKLRLRNSKQKLIRTIVKETQTLLDDKKQLQLNSESEKIKKQLLKVAMLKLKFGKTTEFEVATLRQDYIEQQQATVAKRMQFFLDYNQLYLDRGDLLSLWHLTLQY